MEKRIKIDDGATLITVPFDKYKTDVITINYILPLSEENITTSNLLASVLTRGCEKYKTVTEINRALVNFYSPHVSIMHDVYTNCVLFKIACHYIDGKFLPEKNSDILNDIMNFIKEMILHPLVKDGEFNPTYVESEKKLIKERIRARIDNKDGYARYQATKLTLGDIPAASDTIGNEEILDKITPKSLYTSFQEILEKSKILVLYCGRTDENVENKLVNLIKDLENGRNPENTTDVGKVIKPVFKDEVRKVEEKADATQSRLILSYSVPVNNDNIPTAMIFNEIFGSSPVSRLFSKIREEMHMCYSCRSNISQSMAVMYVSSGISAENKEAVAKEIANQLENISNEENITDKEIMFAKKSFESILIQIKDGLGFYCTWLLSRIILGFNNDIDQYAKGISEVTKKDVADFAGKIKQRAEYFLKGEGSGDLTGND